MKILGLGGLIIGLPGSMYIYTQGNHSLSLLFAVMALSGLIVYAKSDSTERQGGNE